MNASEARTISESTLNTNHADSILELVYKCIESAAKRGHQYAILTEIIQRSRQNLEETGELDADNHFSPITISYVEKILSEKGYKLHLNKHSYQTTIRW